MKRFAGGLVALLLATSALVVSSATAAHAQTISHTFVAVQCQATVNGQPLTQAQDISVTIIAPDVATPNQPFTLTFPGGSALLPSTSNGLTITSYSNQTLTYQIHGTTFTAGSVVNPGTAELVPTAPPSTPVNIVQTATVAGDKFTTGNPGPFVPGTLNTPSISVSAIAPASGDITLNAFQLTTSVKLNGVINTSVVCSIPTDTVLTIPTSPANTPPTVNAGSDGSGNVGDAIAVSGTVTDPDNTPTHAWTSDSPFCSFADPSALATTITCTHAGVFAATLTGNDGINTPVTDSAQITVLTPNVAPTVNAGPNVAGQVSDDIELNGTVTDPDDDPNTLWTVDSPDCSFDDETSIDTVINCTTPGTFAATLTADDGINAPVSDSTQVVVSPIPPGLTVLAGPDASGNVSTPIPLDGKITDPGHTPTSLWTIDGPGMLVRRCNVADDDRHVHDRRRLCRDALGAGRREPRRERYGAHHGYPAERVSTGQRRPGRRRVSSTTRFALHGTVTDPDNTPVVQLVHRRSELLVRQRGCGRHHGDVHGRRRLRGDADCDDGVNEPVSDAAIVTVQANASPTVNAGPGHVGSCLDPDRLERQRHRP